ncbi:MAG: Xaa-Pro peptidase family protein [Thermoplasmata archaeon]|nr:Xaa-Pro peptidase family protein [Thermoplasmata archaeon]
MKDRVRRVMESLSPKADALVLANSVEPHLDMSFFYLFDAPSGLFEGSHAVAFPDGRLHVFSSPLEEESARQAAKGDSSVEVHTETGDEKQKVLKGLLGSSKNVALNFHELTHESYLAIAKAFPKASFSDASEALRRVRRIKDKKEVERLERAAGFASKVATEIPSMLHRGMTELELAAEIEHRMMLGGAAGRSFATIVGFGPKSAEPHYAPADRPLTPGVSIVCDFGALCERYASDITRSFRFGPRDDELKRVHETVARAQAAALEVIRPGAIAKDVHGAAQAVVDASPWKGRFTHGLGHSIGLAVHDGFAMNHLIDVPLEEGMAITVEPGIYLPGRGGVRIEDDIVVTRNGYRFLTTAPREYIEVPA